MPCAQPRHGPQDKARAVLIWVIQGPQQRKKDREC